MIALERVAKAYPTASGRKVLLDDATAEFLPGHNVGILGANGSGKSTLIRLLAGTELPDRGTIRRDARVSFPLGFDATFHPALSRTYVSNTPTPSRCVAPKKVAHCAPFLSTACGNCG